MTTRIKEDIWWICWFTGVGGSLCPALLPGNDKGPHFLNEHDVRNIIKKVKITKTYINFTLSSVLHDYPFEGVSDDSIAEPKSSVGTAPAS